MENILDFFRKVAKDEATHYTYLDIPFSGTTSDPLEVYGSYFRITLCQMFLEASRKWGTELFPAAHTAIRLQYADYEPIELVHVTPVPAQKDLSKGIPLNFTVTGLIPWNGGTVEIFSGLISLHGPDKLKAAVDVLGSFSSLIAAPISQAIAVAGKIATSAQQLMVGNGGNVEFTYHQTYTDVGNPLRPGYYAAILATPQGLQDIKFSVENDQLKADGQDFTGFHFMLFRIDGVKERPDWRMKNVQANINKARDAYRKRNVQDGDGFRGAALAAVDESQDLSYLDKTRIEELIRRELEPLRQVSLGAADDLDPNKSFELDEMRQNAMSWDEAFKLGPQPLKFS